MYSVLEKLPAGDPQKNRRGAKSAEKKRRERALKAITLQ